MPAYAMCRHGYGKVSNLQTSKVMKRLDLSCLPLNLEVGEIMELIDKKGKYHLLKCVMSDKKKSCKGCFFTKAEIPFNCDSVMCSELERGVNNSDVIYIELPVKDEFKQDEESEDDVYYEE